MEEAQEQLNKVIEIIPMEALLKDRTKFSLFQKTLMITDGTVTDLLKLYTHQKIIVKKINQEILKSSYLDINGFEDNTKAILKREILLGNEEENYIYADSFIIYENMPLNMQYQLLEENKPIGLLWREEELDTFREIIEIRLEHCKELIKYFNLSEEVPFLARTYRVYSEKKVLACITEKFPITYFIN